MPSSKQTANALGAKTSGPALGLWVTLESASISEIATCLQLDWIVVDAEHGHLDLKEIVEHLRATRNTNTTALVRVQEIEQGQIKRVLDIGADGVLIPQVKTAAEVEQAVQFAMYPPRGIRGIGAERSTRWGMSMRQAAQTANDRTLVIPLIETREALENIDAILAVPGIAAIFFGPADLSASLGYPGEWEGEGVAEKILAVRQKAADRNIPCGVIAPDVEDAQRRASQGFKMIGIGLDAGLLIRSCTQMLTGLGRVVPQEAWQ
jgi:2-keto-3-deoxy-L-rhamnonate aldolase RhmA